MQFRIKFLVLESDAAWIREIDGLDRYGRAALLKLVLRDAHASGRIKALKSTLGIEQSDLATSQTTQEIRPSEPPPTPKVVPPVFIPAPAGSEPQRPVASATSNQSTKTRQHPVRLPVEASTPGEPLQALETIELDQITPTPSIPRGESQAQVEDADKASATVFDPSDPRQLLGFFG